MIRTSSALLAALLLATGGALPATAAQTGPSSPHVPLPRPEVSDLEQGRKGAIASHGVAVDGRPVGRMYRDEAENPLDSGWIFLAGDEDQAAMSDMSRLGIYDVDALAAHDPAIIPYLDLPIGTDLVRSGEAFVPRRSGGN